MPQNCKGGCESHRAGKSFAGFFYGNGVKRCTICDIYIKWDGLGCPCCGARLRLGKRNKNQKVSMKVTSNI